MENNFKDEEPTIKIINNNKALQYKVKYNGKNIMKVPAYKQWLDLMKTEKGDNGIICYCIKCHLFYYFENYEQKNNDFECKYDLAEFCEYCGELYCLNSICCFRAQLKIFNRIIYREFHLNREDYLIFMPIIIIMFYFTTFFEAIYYKRWKGQDINNIKDFIRDSNCFVGILAFLIIIYVYHRIKNYKIFFYNL